MSNYTNRDMIDEFKELRQEIHQQIEDQKSEIFDNYVLQKVHDKDIAHFEKQLETLKDDIEKTNKTLEIYRKEEKEDFKNLSSKFINRSQYIVGTVMVIVGSLISFILTNYFYK